MGSILIVDDEAAHRDSLRRIFERAGHAVIVAKDGEDALALLPQRTIDVVVTDLVMPGLDGRALLAAVARLRPDVDVVLMTAYGNVENAVAAMREGAKDFLTKPVRRGELLTCVDRLFERRHLVAENQALRAELSEAQAAPSTVRGVERLLGASPSMLEVKATLSQVAKSTATVLLVGESGTGKELCARAIHELSPRAQAPLVAVNCAALPESLLEVELFGAEKGAFTGIDERRLGRFERAHGGTLFLDKVSEIPLPMQVKLLRALQEGEIERLGGSGAVRVDVRVIAASQHDLLERTKRGTFREDLYYRLDVVSLRVPPLREREGDIAVLAHAYLAIHAAKHGRTIAAFEPRAPQALLSWPFPGNVRELSHAVERAVVLCPDGASLRFEDLPPAIKAQQHTDDAHETLTFRVGQMTLPQLERAAIDATMTLARGDKVKAAKLLGVSLRTLYRRLDEKAAAHEEEDDASDDG